MMTPGMGARPPLALPAVQAHQLGTLIDRNDAVDLPVRVCVILALEVVLAVDRAHVDGGHGAEFGGFGGRRDARAAVALAVDGNVSDPAFGEAELDEVGQVVVVWGAGAVVCVEVVFERLAWGAVHSNVVSVKCCEMEDRTRGVRVLL